VVSMNRHAGEILRNGNLRQVALKEGH